MVMNPLVQQGILAAVQGGALGKVPDQGLGSLAAQTPATASIVEGEKPGFFERLFPERDPNTGKQGGLLANPLFRIGLNMLARSGPQKNPTDLGQILAGSIGDYASQRNEEDGAASNYMQLSKQRQQWGDEQGKREWAKDLNPEELLALSNPTGNPEALKVQTSATDRGGYFKNLAGLESGGNPNAKNKLSTASGLYQFIDGTRAWVDKQGNFNPNDRSLETEQKRIDLFTKVNEDNLRMRGLPINDTTRYATHLMGSKGGADFIEKAIQNPNASAEQLVGQKVANANAKIFKGRTAGEVLGIIEQSITAGKWIVPPVSQAQFSSNPTAAPPVAMPKFAQFPTAQAQPQVQPEAASSMQPQVASPQSPAVQPQGGAPLPAQSQPTPPVSGEAMAPAGEPTQPTTPPLVMDEKGRPTKSSILEALKALPIENRNQLITGAWLKAAGNKKEFAEHLGNALLAQSGKSDEYGFKSPTSYQQVDMIDQTTGRKFKGSYNPRNGQVYEPDGKGGLVLAPTTSVPTTAGALAPLNQVQFDKLANQITEDEIGLQKLDNYVKRIAGTNVGINRWVDAISQNFKTLIGGRENGLDLTKQELNRAIAKGDLEALVGLFRLDIVGPGVMTAQDAQFIKEALGGDVGGLQDPEVVKERLKLMIEQKVKRMQPSVDSFNRNAIYYGAKPKIVDVPDTSKWDLFPNMRPSNPDQSAAPVKKNIKSITKVSE